MKIYLKNEAIQRKNSDTCIVTEYPIDDKNIDFAIVKISGKYPNEKYAINTLCKEIVYVHDGHGKITVNDKEILINAGDVILVEVNEKFCWEGNMTLYISCNPAFTTEQHKIVD